MALLIQYAHFLRHKQPKFAAVQTIEAKPGGWRAKPTLDRGLVSAMIIAQYPGSFFAPWLCLPRMA